MDTPIDSVTTFLHDRLCLCGDRCDGWQRDREALLAFSEERWGSRVAIDAALDELDQLAFERGFDAAELPSIQ